jgi:ATP-binding cassette subfamily E protein 1
MIFKGIPSFSGIAESPVGKDHGMNTFLKELKITYRRDLDTGRPRINKPGSKLDRMQKDTGRYYYISKFGDNE